MKLLEEDLKCTKPILCEIERNYMKYMHEADWRVSVKYKRKFVGLAVRINGRIYVVPLTSQTTRSAAITTFIKIKGEEIANLLHNNMFPVPKNQLKKSKLIHL